MAHRGVQGSPRSGGRSDACRASIRVGAPPSLNAANHARVCTHALNPSSTRGARWTRHSRGAECGWPLMRARFVPLRAPRAGWGCRAERGAAPAGVPRRAGVLRERGPRRHGTTALGKFTVGGGTAIFPVLPSLAPGQGCGPVPSGGVAARRVSRRSRSCSVGVQVTLSRGFAVLVRLPRSFGGVTARVFARGRLPASRWCVGGRLALVGLRRRRALCSRGPVRERIARWR